MIVLRNRKDIMKILYHHRTLGDGAEGIHIAEMVRAFRNIGHEVRVVAPIGEETGVTNDKVSLLSRIKNALPRVTYEFLEIGYNAVGYKMIRRTVQEWRPDLIYDRYITFNASAVLAGMHCNIPVILEVNAPLALERSRQKDEKLYLRKPAFFMERWICSHARKTIVVSTPLKDYLVSAGVPASKLTVMPNGVNLENFQPRDGKSRELLQKLAIPENATVVGFVGVLRMWHGLELLADAFHRLRKTRPDLHLLIAGDGPIRPDLEAQAALYGLSRHMTITGRVPHTEVPEYISLFDIAVSPRATFYASPMKILEYMALGVPVVAPDMPNIRDIITDGSDGLLFAPENSVSFADAIARLADDESLRKSIRTGALETVHTRRNWIRNAEDVMALI